MPRPIPPALKDANDIIKKIKHTKGDFRRSKCIRGLYLALNRESFDEIPLKVLYSAFKRIPSLNEQIRHKGVHEKYIKLLNDTFSKFINRYNKLINEQVEITCLIRQMLGHDISTVITEYIDYNV
tara:strand:+ start:848 stop:1222 length:375 start_codon:yes stop_codon:yes gene_type:complete